MVFRSVIARNNTPNMRKMAGSIGLTTRLDRAAGEQPWLVASF
jgi:hypothetical protein